MLVNNVEILVSPSNNLSGLFLTFSFNLSILFIFSFADNTNSLSLSKFLNFKCLNFLRYCLFHHLAYLTFFFHNFLFCLSLVL